MLNKKSSNGSLQDVSIISKGVNIEGKFKSEGSVRIDGIVNGDVIVGGNLTVGETAEVTGEVKAENITLCGKIFGQVFASDKLVMESKSYLKGDLCAKILVVEPGAFFDGKCQMTSDQKEE
ncbi:MAG: polymer-forming cytoskeletal protein [Bacteroidota bacterium]|nr:polymer-forming cytoskeletal protein [Bacteroidota bacterium]MDP4192716.1 polymer-forming cytoskeletal protein [Bacteroidota bacterium]MDP4194420.1 polymer-forming cytoskeletal protein [Bacteroidota bacterium]